MKEPMDMYEKILPAGPRNHAGHNRGALAPRWEPAGSSTWLRPDRATILADSQSEGLVTTTKLPQIYYFVKSRMHIFATK